MDADFNMFNFGPWLKEESEKQNLNGKELAAAAHVSEQAICCYKKQTRFPTYETMGNILNALGYELQIVKKRRRKKWQ